MARPDSIGTQLLKEGYVFRGDSYISDEVVELRYGMLWSDGFVTKRHPDSKGNGKVWPLNRKCRVKPIDQKDLTVLRSSHTVLSLIYGRYDSKKLYCFKVQWQSRGVLAKESLVLAFEESAVATEWRQHFNNAILALQQQVQSEDTGSKQLKKTLKARHPDQLQIGPNRQQFQPPYEGAEVQGDWTPLEASSTPLGRVRRSAVTGSPRPTTGTDVRLEQETYTPKPAMSVGELSSILGDSHLDLEQQSVDYNHEPMTWTNNTLPGRSPKVSTTTIELNSFTPDLPIADDTSIPKDWSPFRVLNGLAVYKEEELNSGQGGAYMLSGCMKSSPRACFEALLDIRGQRSNIWAFTSITQVKYIDKHTILFRALMTPQGSLARILKPREVILQRSWRMEEDGSYFVVFSSVDHPDFPGETPDVQRAHIDAMNFTISPLKSPPSDDQLSAQSQECLVTVVLKVDLGGIFNRDSWVRRLLFFVDSWERTWIETLLMTVVALRDKVEQDRFVARPDMVRMGNAEAASQSSRSADVSTTRALPDGGVESRTGRLVPMQPSSPSATTAEAEDELLELRDAESIPKPVDSEQKSARQLTTPPVWLDQRYWSCPGTAGFKVRGPTYLSDKKKIPSEEPVFALAGVELVKFPTTTYHVSRYLPAVRHSVAPFNFVLCFQLPFGGQVNALALIFAADYLPSSSSSQDDSSQDDNEELEPFDLNMARFLASEEGINRNGKLKLIPSLAVGSWIMRQAVGQTPVMLGKKLKTEYFKGDGYFEADIDISSNSTAANITSMVAGAIKSLVFDIGILLEGHHTEELPERLLGSARLNHLDLKEARSLDMSVELTQVPRKALKCMGGPGGKAEE